MPANLLKPIAKTLVASGLVSATGNSAAITLPLAESYMFILDCTAINTGTTMDVALQTSLDGGTSYYGVAKFAQITTVAIATRLAMQPVLARGEAASSGNVGNSITEMTAGAAIIGNLPLTQDIRFRWIIVGTSYTFSIKAIIVPRVGAVGY